MYQALAIKWRPQQYDQVVGQKHVTTTLVNAIKLKRLGHAYLDLRQEPQLPLLG